MWTAVIARSPRRSRTPPRFAASTSLFERPVSVTRSSASSRCAMRRSPPPRRGVALLAALIALAIVAALLTAAFFSALQTDRSSRLIERQAEVRSAAERAVDIALTQWNTPARAAQSIGASAFVPPAQQVAHVGALVWVTRISAR